MITVRSSTIHDPSRLAHRLRPEDVREISALGSNPIQALTEGFLGDRCLTVEDCGLPIAMFGVRTIPLKPEFGAIWLLASEALFERARYRFMRESRHWVEYLESGYLATLNIADVRNEAHLRWLRWLGYTFLAKLPLGTNGEIYQEFIKCVNPQP